MSATFTWMATDARPIGGGADPTAAGGADVDLDLVHLAQQGDQQAFGQLIDRNRRAVYRAAFAALGSAAEAEDVAQETFVAVFQKLHTFRGESAFRTWLLSIAWRKALTRRRSIGRWVRMSVTRTRDDDGASAIERLPAPERSQEERATHAELQRTLKRLIATLPRKLRDALLLAGSGDYSYEQIAQMLGVPPGTVKWRVSEARRLLKQKLAATGHSND